MDDDILGQAVSVLQIRPDPNNLAKSGFEHWFSQKKSWQNLLADNNKTLEIEDK